MDNFTEQFNEAFQMGLESGSDGLEKLAADTSDYVKMKIREESWSRKIQPMESVGKADITGNLVGDGFHILVEAEPDSKAVFLNLKAQPEAREIEGQRFQANFYTISTERLEKTQNELLAYKMPITKVLQENNVLDMQQKEDEKFYQIMNTAVDATGGLKTQAMLGEGELMSKQNITQGLRLHSSNGSKLKTKSMLMTEYRFNDILDWDATTVGSEVAGNVAKVGWDTPTLFSKTLHVTNKNDTKLPGAASSTFDDEIWFFTSPKFMGKSYLFENLRFWIGKEGRMVYWESWEDIAQLIVNHKSVAKLELTPYVGP